jgi:addiction module RelE/StbE family toxin
MWTVLESKAAQKTLNDAPRSVVEKYLAWRTIVEISGSQGLRAIKGFRDEVLKGNWKGYRSSRLSDQYRVIYRVDRDKITVYVIDVTAHDYRRK